MNAEGLRLIDLYIRRVLREVRAGKETKEKIKGQLEEHIWCTLEDTGDYSVPAVKTAIANLGSPITVGKSYNESYQVYMSIVDWTQVIFPWLLAPLCVLAGLLRPTLWAGYLFTAIYAMLCGVILGKRLSKWPLCVYSALLPLLLPALAAIPSLRHYLAELIPIAVIWVAVFSLSCLWCYGEIALTIRVRKIVQGASAAIACACLCLVFGLWQNSYTAMADVQRNSLWELSYHTKTISETSPSDYSLAIPYTAVLAIDEAAVDIEVSTGCYMGIYSFLNNLALFVDDYDEFRGGDQRQMYLENENTLLTRQVFWFLANYDFTNRLDCSTLEDLDLSQRQAIANVTFKELSDIFSRYIPASALGLEFKLSQNDLAALLKEVAQAEDKFYDGLWQYSSIKSILEPKMEFISASDVNKMDFEELWSKCRATGVVISEAQDLSSQAMTEIFGKTNFSAAEDYFIEGYRDDLLRYMILYCDEEGFQLMLAEANNSGEDSAKMFYDEIKTRSNELWEELY